MYYIQGAAIAEKVSCIRVVEKSSLRYIPAGALFFQSTKCIIRQHHMHAVHDET